MDAPEANQGDPEEVTSLAVIAIEESGIGSRSRDERGLLPIQTAFLQRMFEEGGSIRRACRNLSIKESRVRTWMKTDPAFKGAYLATFAGPDGVEDARALVQSVAAKAAELLDEATEAKKPLTQSFDCAHCGKKNSVTIHIDDWNVRLKALEQAAKMVGLLTDRKEIKVKGLMVKANVELSADDILALAAYRLGMDVPERALAKLRAAGIIE